MRGVSGVMDVPTAFTVAILPGSSGGWIGMGLAFAGILVWIAWKLRGEWIKSQRLPEGAVEKKHPVLGTFMDRISYWTASVPAAEGVGGALEISAGGREPTDEQLRMLDEVRGRLPAILTRLEPVVAAPLQDGSTRPLPFFRLTEAKWLHLAVAEDGSFHGRLIPSENPDFQLKLVLEVDREGKLTNYMWRDPEGFAWEGPDYGGHEPRWLQRQGGDLFGAREDEEVEVSGAGKQATEDQLRRLREIGARLPDLLRKLAPLVGVLELDSRRDQASPAFDLAEARVLRVGLWQWGCFGVELFDRREGDHVRPEFSLEIIFDEEGKVMELDWNW